MNECAKHEAQATIHNAEDAAKLDAAINLVKSMRDMEWCTLLQNAASSMEQYSKVLHNDIDSWVRDAGSDVSIRR